MVQVASLSVLGAGLGALGILSSLVQLVVFLAVANPPSSPVYVYNNNLSSNGTSPVILYKNCTCPNMSSLDRTGQLVVSLTPSKLVASNPTGDGLQSTDLVAGTGVTIVPGSSPQISIGQSVGVGATVNFGPVKTTLLLEQTQEGLGKGIYGQVQSTPSNTPFYETGWNEFNTVATAATTATTDFTISNGFAYFFTITVCVKSSTGSGRVGIYELKFAIFANSIGNVTSTLLNTFKDESAVNVIVFNINTATANLWKISMTNNFAGNVNMTLRYEWTRTRL
jgi:hypothetical protein